MAAIGSDDDRAGGLARLVGHQPRLLTRGPRRDELDPIGDRGLVSRDQIRRGRAEVHGHGLKERDPRILVGAAPEQEGSRGDIDVARGHRLRHVEREPDMPAAWQDDWIEDIRPPRGMQPHDVASWRELDARAALPDPEVLGLDRDLGMLGRVDLELHALVPACEQRAVRVVRSQARDHLVAAIGCMDRFGEHGAVVQDRAEHRADVSAGRILGECGLDPSGGRPVGSLGRGPRGQDLRPELLRGLGLAAIEARVRVRRERLLHEVSAACLLQDHGRGRHFMRHHIRQAMVRHIALDRDRGRDQRDHPQDRHPPDPDPPAHPADRRGDELALERGQLRLVQRARFRETRPEPGLIPTPTGALPLGSRGRHALAPCAVLGIRIEPVAQRGPAPDQDLVRELVRRALLAVVGHDQASADQLVQGDASALPDRELGIGTAYARPERGHEPQQDPTSEHPLDRRHPRDHRVTMTSKRARDAAHELERRSFDDMVRSIASLPELGERER